MTLLQAPDRGESGGRQVKTKILPRFSHFDDDRLLLGQGSAAQNCCVGSFNRLDGKDRTVSDYHTLTNIKFTYGSGVLPAEFNILPLFFRWFFPGNNPCGKEQMTKIQRRFKDLDPFGFKNVSAIARRIASSCFRSILFHREMPFKSGRISRNILVLVMVPRKTVSPTPSCFKKRYHLAELAELHPADSISRLYHFLIGFPFVGHNHDPPAGLMGRFDEQ